MRCLWIALALLAGCSAAIEHNLDERQANEVVTSLERAGISASKSRDENNGDAFAVSVAKADVVRAIELLRSLALPRGKRAGFGEVYKQASLLPTPTEERARYTEALAGEIGRTLEAVDGVLQARVHLVLPEPDPLALDGKPRVAAQAAVLLKTRAGRPAAISESDVRRLVAGSAPGLDGAAVAVVFTSAAEPAPKAAGLAALGPLRMTAESRTVVIAIGAAACLLLALLAALVLVMSRRLAASQGRPPSPKASS
jgi:type III secretion protein J